MKAKLSHFSKRHIGPNANEISEMLNNLGYNDIDSFLNDLVPSSIIDIDSINFPAPIYEYSELNVQ